jgi:hypothetical protein
MRKLFLLGLLLIAGCDDGKVTKVDETVGFNAYHYKYNGHEYIYFRQKDHRDRCGMVHDPDCKKCNAANVMFEDTK